MNLPNLTEYHAIYLCYAMLSIQNVIGDKKKSFKKIKMDFDSITLHFRNMVQNCKDI